MTWLLILALWSSQGGYSAPIQISMASKEACERAMNIYESRAAFTVSCLNTVTGEEVHPKVIGR